MVVVRFCSGLWTGKLFKKGESKEVDLNKVFACLKSSDYSVVYDPVRPPYAAIVKKEGISITLHHTGSVSITGKKEMKQVVGIISDLYSVLEKGNCFKEEED